VLALERFQQPNPIRIIHREETGNDLDIFVILLVPMGSHDSSYNLGGYIHLY